MMEKTLDNQVAADQMVAAQMVEPPHTQEGSRKPGRPRGRPKKAVTALKANPQKQPAKRGRKKRPKDMPRRPLSAYNLYFKRKREAIIKDRSPEDIIESAEALRGVEGGDEDSEVAKKKINLFQALAVLISKQWKQLQPEDKKEFEEQAQEEMKAYRKKLGVYQMGLAEKASKEEAAKAEAEALAGDNFDPEMGGNGFGGKKMDPQRNALANATSAFSSRSSSGAFPLGQSALLGSTGLGAGGLSGFPGSMPPHFGGLSSGAGSELQQLQLQQRMNAFGGSVGAANGLAMQNGSMLGSGAGFQDLMFGQQQPGASLGSGGAYALQQQNMMSMQGLPHQYIDPSAAQLYGLRSSMGAQAGENMMMTMGSGGASGSDLQMLLQQQQQQLQQLQQQQMRQQLQLQQRQLQQQQLGTSSPLIGSEHSMGGSQRDNKGGSTK